eukprot:TRINITY_DN23966_c0_g2_i1.p1 TRINITY_DN23966_c0_g2~~TRINITY_DN23966_c0_g2_i1.p1  ORF type:complete len:1351 (-),score=173.71 TRINITY_DN23966_c0_g2_i1:191-4243(-)
MTTSLGSARASKLTTPQSNGGTSPRGVTEGKVARTSNGSRSRSGGAPAATDASTKSKRPSPSEASERRPSLRDQIKDIRQSLDALLGSPDPQQGGSTFGGRGSGRSGSSGVDKNRGDEGSPISALPAPQFPPAAPGPSIVSVTPTTPEASMTGPYEVVHDGTVVQVSAIPGSKWLAELPEGTRVDVVEVVHMETEARLRGRLVKPPGWISLTDTDGGYQWAVPADPLPAKSKMQSSGASETHAAPPQQSRRSSTKQQFGEENPGVSWFDKPIASTGNEAVTAADVPPRHATPVYPVRGTAALQAGGKPTLRSAGVAPGPEDRATPSVSPRKGQPLRSAAVVDSPEVGTAPISDWNDVFGGYASRLAEDPPLTVPSAGVKSSSLEDPPLAVQPADEKSPKAPTRSQSGKKKTPTKSEAKLKGKAKEAGSPEMRNENKIQMSSGQAKVGVKAETPGSPRQKDFSVNLDIWEPEKELGTSPSPSSQKGEKALALRNREGVEARTAPPLSTVEPLSARLAPPPSLVESRSARLAPPASLVEPRPVSPRQFSDASPRRLAEGLPGDRVQSAMPRTTGLLVQQLQEPAAFADTRRGYARTNDGAETAWDPINRAGPCLVDPGIPSPPRLGGTNRNLGATARSGLMGGRCGDVDSGNFGGCGAAASWTHVGVAKREDDAASGSHNRPSPRRHPAPVDVGPQRTPQPHPYPQQPKQSPRQRSATRLSGTGVPPSVPALGGPPQPSDSSFSRFMPSSRDPPMQQQHLFSSESESFPKSLPNSAVLTARSQGDVSEQVSTSPTVQRDTGGQDGQGKSTHRHSHADLASSKYALPDPPVSEAAPVVLPAPRATSKRRVSKGAATRDPPLQGLPVQDPHLQDPPLRDPPHTKFVAVSIRAPKRVASRVQTKSVLRNVDPPYVPGSCEWHGPLGERTSAHTQVATSSGRVASPRRVSPERRPPSRERASSPERARSPPRPVEYVPLPPQRQAHSAPTSQQTPPRRRRVQATPKSPVVGGRGIPSNPQEALRAEATAKAAAVVAAATTQDASAATALAGAGRVYMGFRNDQGQKDGYGVMRGKDGTIYSGQWASGRREGHGTLFFEGGVFEGSWRNGGAEGKGTVQFKNGDAFTGMYSNNEKCGLGVYRWTDGAEEQGEYLNGKKVGWHRWRQSGDEWELLYEDGSVQEAKHTKSAASVKVDATAPSTPPQRTNSSSRPKQKAKRQAAPTSQGRSPRTATSAAAAEEVPKNVRTARAGSLDEYLPQGGGGAVSNSKGSKGGSVPLKGRRSRTPSLGPSAGADFVQGNATARNKTASTPPVQERPADDSPEPQQPHPLEVSATGDAAAAVDGSSLVGDSGVGPFI